MSDEKPKEILPIDPMREGGIRTWHTVSEKHGTVEAGMVGDLLLALDRQRKIIQGLRTELSVHERRVRTSRISMLTDAEEAMLKFCVDAGYQVYLSNDGFTEEDGKAMDYLRETFGVL